MRVLEVLVVVGFATLIVMPGRLRASLPRHLLVLWQTLIGLAGAAAGVLVADHLHMRWRGPVNPLPLYMLGVAAGGVVGMGAAAVRVRLMPGWYQFLARPRRANRRWFQFSLRTLLIVVTAFTVWLGPHVNRANQQRRAVEAITNAGGKISYLHQRQPYQRHSYAGEVEAPGPKWLRAIIGDHYFVTPVKLYMRDQRVIDQDCLAQLRNLPHLEGIHCNRVRLRAKDVEQLQHLTKLRTLWLSKGALGQIQDKRCLRAIPASVESLSIGLNNEDLVHLTHLTNLRKLDLSNSRISDQGLEHLEAFDRLTYLNLNGTSVTDEGLQQLVSLRSLGDLNVAGTRVTKSGVDEFQVQRPGRVKQYR